MKTQLTANHCREIRQKNFADKRLYESNPRGQLANSSPENWQSNQSAQWPKMVLEKIAADVLIRTPD
jgi:hypothetical protein